MLIVDLHPLQAIHVLDLVDHIIGQSLNTHNRKNVMRRGVAIHDVITLLDEITFLDRDVLAFWHHVFDFCQSLVSRFNRYAALVFIVFAKAHIAINFCNDRVIFGATGLKQFRNPRQTTGDVFGSATLARDTRKNVTRLDVLTIFNGENRIDGHGIGNWIAIFTGQHFTLFIGDDDFWRQFAAF